MVSTAAAWALIAVSAVNGSEFILASSFAVTSDCDGVGSIDSDDLGIVFDGEAVLFNDDGKLKPGFYLWTGAVVVNSFSDDSDLAYEGVVAKLAPALVASWLAKHESEPPQESPSAAEPDDEDDRDQPRPLGFGQSYTNREDDGHDGSEV